MFTRSPASWRKLRTLPKRRFRFWREAGCTAAQQTPAPAADSHWRGHHSGGGCHRLLSAPKLSMSALENALKHFLYRAQTIAITGRSYRLNVHAADASTLVSRTKV